MTPRFLLVCLVTASLVGALLVPRCWTRRSTPSEGVTMSDMPLAAAGAEFISHVPTAFVPNHGQWSRRARFVTRHGPMSVFLEDRGWTFTLERLPADESVPLERSGSSERRVQGAAVRMTFVGGNETVLIPEGRMPGVHHYFLGDDPANWCRDVPRFRSVRYENTYDGIDVRAREHDGHFEYDLLLAPGASLDEVEMLVEGADGLRLDRDGALVIEAALGEVRMAPPPSWQITPGGDRSGVSCRYVLLGSRSFGFVAPGREPQWQLVVDPGLVWSSFLGGTGRDNASAVALDSQGAPTIAGFTASTNFPTTPGSFDRTYNGGLHDVFITRLSADGKNLVYSTFLGGSGHEFPSSIALDAAGAVTVAGGTYSTNFPTTNGAFDTTHGGGVDAFVTRLSAGGSNLAYSTYLGDASNDTAYAIALDGTGAATVAGGTSSVGFPTTNLAYDRTHNGASDIFLTRLGPGGGQLVYSTFFGGSNHDNYAGGLVVDVSGVATVAGWTSSQNFPTTPGAFDRTSGGDDAFIARFGPRGQKLIWSTVLGGSASESDAVVAVDANGVVTVAGWTNSADFPVSVGAFDTSYNGNDDVYISRLDPSKTGPAQLVFSTFLGGAGHDSIGALGMDAEGAATVAGRTNSASFPTSPGAFDRTSNGGVDAFVARIAPSGARLTYSTLLGGSRPDGAVGLAVNARGGCTVVGFSASAGFPTTSGTFDSTHNGDNDVFVCELDMLPTGVSAYGRSSPGCSGSLSMSVNAIPQIGNASFALTCGNAPASASGWLLLGADRLTNPLVLVGTEVWIDPQGAWFSIVPASSSPDGVAHSRLPVPNSVALVGKTARAQFAWAGPSFPGPCPFSGISASHALSITIQR